MSSVLTGRRGRLAAVAVAAALVPATAVAGAGVRAQAASGGDRAGAAGTISTIAGGVGGPAKATRVDLTPTCAVAFGGGYLYIGNGDAVRRVNPGSDELTTPAGTGTTGPLGDGGLATKAWLNNACAVAVDHAGNLVIAEFYNDRIRMVTG